MMTEQQILELVDTLGQRWGSLLSQALLLNITLEKRLAKMAANETALQKKIGDLEAELKALNTALAARGATMDDRRWTTDDGRPQQPELVEGCPGVTMDGGR